MSEKSKNLMILGSAHGDSNTLKAVLKTTRLEDCTIVDLFSLRIEHYVYGAAPQDDFLSVVEKMLAAETITFATPVYWYSMSGRMKVFFDRLSDLLDTQNGRSLAGKNIDLVVVGAGAELPPGFEVPFGKTASYFGMKFRKTFYYQM